MYIKNKHLFFIILLLILSLYSAWINQHPEGYIIATDDNIFIPADIQKNYINNFYLWGHIVNGAGTLLGGDPSDILHNGLFYYLDLVGISDTQKQNIKYFIFIFFSGLSMYLAVGIFFRYQVKALTQFIVAIFYSFNGITLVYVSSTGVYGVYLDLYIFLPLIWSLFTIGLIDKKINYLILSIIFVFLSVSGFHNPAYLILLLLFLICTVIFCWITGQIRFKQVLLSGLVFSAYFLVISPYSLHLMNYGLNPVQVVKEMLSDSEYLRSWIQRNSISIIYNLRFMLNGSGDNFPDLFPYDFIPKQLFILFSFYPTFLIIFSFLFIKDKKYQKWFIFWGIVYLFALFGSAKSTLSDKISLFIFTLPVLTVFRSYEKFAILLPLLSSFFLCFILEGIRQKLKTERMKLLIYFIIIFIILVYPLPFFLGKFHTTYNRDFLYDYKYSDLVKMPEYYRDLADYANSDTEDYKILSMPYSGQIGLGWVLYPKWRYAGVDYTTLYFNNPVFSPVNYSFGHFNEAEYLHQNPIEGRDIFMDFIRSRSVRYLIVNKDVENIYLVSFQKLFQGVKDNFTFIKSFGNLDLYRVSSDIELPIIYTVSAEKFTADKKHNTAQKKELDELIFKQIKDLNLRKENRATFKKINPTKYIVKIENTNQPFWLIFSESYHPQWDIYDGTKTKDEFDRAYLNITDNDAQRKMKFTPMDVEYLFRKPIDTNHILANGFANAWYIDPKEFHTDGNGNFFVILYFKPQSYFYMGLVLSGLTLAFCIGYLIWDLRKKLKALN